MVKETFSVFSRRSYLLSYLMMMVILFLNWFDRFVLIMFFFVLECNRMMMSFFSRLNDGQGFLENKYFWRGKLPPTKWWRWNLLIYISLITTAISKKWKFFSMWTLFWVEIGLIFQFFSWWNKMILLQFAMIFIYEWWWWWWMKGLFKKISSSLP